MQFSTSLICLVRNFKAFLMEKFPQDLDFQNVKKIMNRWSVINMRSFTQINVNREKKFHLRRRKWRHWNFLHFQQKP